MSHAHCPYLIYPPRCYPISTDTHTHHHVISCIRPLIHHSWVFFLWRRGRALRFSYTYKLVALFSFTLGDTLGFVWVSSAMLIIYLTLPVFSSVCRLLFTFTCFIFSLKSSQVHPIYSILLHPTPIPYLIVHTKIHLLLTPHPPFHPCLATSHIYFMTPLSTVRPHQITRLHAFPAL